MFILNSCLHIAVPNPYHKKNIKKNTYVISGIVGMAEARLRNGASPEFENVNKTNVSTENFDNVGRRWAPQNVAKS